LTEKQPAKKKITMKNEGGTLVRRSGKRQKIAH
jgi:hypothetical protein